MVLSMTGILQRFMDEWATPLQPEAILALCEEIGYTAWRDRLLPPVTTIQPFLLQILHGNTACSHLPHLSGLRFTRAAYCQARARPPVRFFDLLLDRFSRAVQRSAVDDGRWPGHRPCLVDGAWHCQLVDQPIQALPGVAYSPHENSDASSLLQESSLPCGDHQPRGMALFPFLPQLP